MKTVKLKSPQENQSYKIEAAVPRKTRCHFIALRFTYLFDLWRSGLSGFLCAVDFTLRQNCQYIFCHIFVFWLGNTIACYIS